MVTHCSRLVELLDQSNTCYAARLPWPPPKRNLNHAQVLDAIEAAAALVKASSKRMISRGYHDAGFMAQIAPTAMIFIPCRRGLSHHPDEYAAPADLERGVKTLALTLAQLADPAPKGACEKSEL